MTAKLYEYLSSRNPILLVINGDRDEEFEKIFDELSLSKIIYSQDLFVEQAEIFIQKKYKKWLNNESLKVAKGHPSLQKYRWDNQIKGFLETLKKVSF